MNYDDYLFIITSIFPLHSEFIQSSFAYRSMSTVTRTDFESDSDSDSQTLKLLPERERETIVPLVRGIGFGFPVD